MSNTWEQHPELVESCKELWKEGLSAAQIARALGHGLTRNSVIGKVTRLKLKEHGGYPRQARSVMRNTRPKTKPLTIEERAEILQAAPDPELGLVTPFNAKDKHCRYGYGDPSDEGFHYCGRKAVRGSYCPGHHAICHEPLKAGAKISDEDKAMVAHHAREAGMQRVFG
jgi:GcrA cell cycle regulator